MRPVSAKWRSRGARHRPDDAGTVWLCEIRRSVEKRTRYAVVNSELSFQPEFPDKKAVNQMKGMSGRDES